MARRRERSPASDEPTAPFWMATFSDMVTLLLAFFVMIVAMSEVEVKKFEEALSYFQGHTGLLESSAMAPVPRPAIANFSQSEAQEAERFEELLKRLEAQGLTESVEVSLTERGIHLVIADSVMFPSGSAVLLPAAEEALQTVSTAIAPDVTGVVVEGHTDDRPIRTVQYPSNWELSGARAASVVRYLLVQESALDPGRYQASGYGEFRPRASNETPSGRGENRRVEILLSTTPSEPLSTIPANPWPMNAPPTLPLP